MSGDNDAWYEISYYEDQEDGEAGRLMGYNSDFTRLRDATCVARKDGLTHHAWITRHKPNADDSGEIVWSRKPLAPRMSAPRSGGSSTRSRAATRSA